MSNRLIIVLLLVVPLLTACDDIFLKDISNKKVSVVCPVDDYTTSSSQKVLFWWDGMEGADEYELQIVTPDFQNIQQLKVEELLDTVRYSVTLPAGNYQWRIRGLNNSYASEFVTRSLTVQ
jgi:hypothetical protein